ncbi:MAG: amino acid aminotransferase [Pseudomonadota bacterium]
MFSTLDLLPPDPILGLSKAFADDPSPDKIDLGVGVFRTVDGATPVMAAVRQAEAACIEEQTSKSYVSPEGAPGFNDALLKLLLGADHDAVKNKRAVSVQTPGGCGALRIGGELLKAAGGETVHMGAPTWPNHTPLLKAAGLATHMAPYYDYGTSSIDFAAFLSHVETLGAKDILLIHGSCHNPTGADLDKDQIDAVLSAAEQRGFMVLIDIAYHGFANGLDADAYVAREAARRLPEVMISYSCSKNFGLYRERTGALAIVAKNAERAAATRSHILSLARGAYSMPPAHGGALVAKVLSTPDLQNAWRAELEDMTRTIKTNRSLLSKTAKEHGLGAQLDYITTQNGMFSLLPISEKDVQRLIKEKSIYMAASGRINLCGLNTANIEYFCNAYRSVVGA